MGVVEDRLEVLETGRRKEVSMIKRLVRELYYTSWTLGGTLLVLITLSSATLRQGIYISIAAFVLHMLGVAVDYRYDKRNQDDD
mgnify:FL=1